MQSRSCCGAKIWKIRPWKSLGIYLVLVYSTQKAAFYALIVYARWHYQWSIHSVLQKNVKENS